MNKLTKQQALEKIKELEKYIEEIKEKEETKNIWEITTDGSFNGRIFGLGEDGLVYLWVAEDEKWFLYDKENQHITSN